MNVDCRLSVIIDAIAYNFKGLNIHLQCLPLRVRFFVIRFHILLSLHYTIATHFNQISVYASWRVLYIYNFALTLSNYNHNIKK